MTGPGFFLYFQQLLKPAMLLVLCCLSSACLVAGSPPPGAFQAVMAATRELQARSGVTGPLPAASIRRAWRARDLPTGPRGSRANPPMWCMDVDMPGTGQEAAANHLTWIAVWNEDRAHWSATPLLILSSIEPYQRCGLEP
jgi:hypothetical protein